MENNAVKLIAVGDAGVGKTSILNRFINDAFDESESTTLGATFFTKKLKLSNNDVWDTAGQEKYRAIAPIYYREAKAALCVYDTCSQKSFDVMKEWVAELQFNGPQDIAIVGNKIDRYDDQEVSITEAEKYATQKKALFKLVSAKQNKNIQELFDALCLRVKKGKSFSELYLGKSQIKRNSKCC